MSEDKPFAVVDEYRNLVVEGRYLGAGALAGYDAEFLNAAVSRLVREARAGALREAASDIVAERPFDGVGGFLHAQSWLRARAEAEDKGEA